MKTCKYRPIKRFSIRIIFHFKSFLIIALQRKRLGGKFLLGKPFRQQLLFATNNLKGCCSNCEAVYFSESKRSLKSHSGAHKKSVRDCDCDKNEIAKHWWEADHNFNWDQKKVIDSDRESRLIPEKIKETIHSLKNPNPINKNMAWNMAS